MRRVKKKSNVFLRFTLAMAIGGFAGLLAAWVLKGMLESPDLWDTPPERLANRRVDLALEADDPALRYVQALQEGRWKDAVEQTLWMRERLEANPDDMARVHGELIANLSDRSPSGNHWVVYQGVEDQYIFRPDATVEMLRRDLGRKTLARPTAGRTWFKVTYPEKDRALRGENGLSVEHLEVGVSVSADGWILKAALTGNVEINDRSVSYEWAE
jgi:hypothetical protein